MSHSVENIDNSQNRKNNLKASAAAAGGGTVFVLIADSLPESLSIKPILVYLAPTFSVVSSAFFQWILKIHNHHQTNKKLTFVIKQLEEYLNNPITSQTHKMQLIKKMEELQISILSQNMKEVRELFNEENI